jgi:hypothetical protein
LEDERLHPGRKFRGRTHPPLALLVLAKALPAMQRPAAQVEPVGVEGGLDLQPLRLPDQPLGCTDRRAIPWCCTKPCACSPKAVTSFSTRDGWRMVLESATGLPRHALIERQSSTCPDSGQAVAGKHLLGRSGHECVVNSPVASLSPSRELAGL